MKNYKLGSTLSDEIDSLFNTFDRGFERVYIREAIGYNGVGL